MNNIKIKSPFSNSTYSIKYPTLVGYFTRFLYSPFVVTSYSKKYKFKNG